MPEEDFQKIGDLNTYLDGVVENAFEQLAKQKSRATDEQVTVRPQDCVRDKGAGEFAEKQTADQLKRPIRSDTEEDSIPNIALDITQPAKYRPVQLALTFFVLMISLLSCGLGVHVENRFIFGFLLVCFGIAAVALCISVGFSLARVLKTAPPRNDPTSGPFGEEGRTEQEQE